MERVSADVPPLAAAAITDLLTGSEASEFFDALDDMPWTPEPRSEPLSEPPLERSKKDPPKKQVVTPSGAPNGVKPQSAISQDEGPPEVSAVSAPKQVETRSSINV